MTFEIRKFNEADLEQLIDVMIDTKYVEMRFPNIEDRQKLKELILEHVVLEKGTTIVVATVDGKVIGYSMFKEYLQSDKNEFWPIEQKPFAISRGTGLHSNFRGQGIGVKLRVGTDEIAKRQGFFGMLTDIDSNNHASIKMNLSAGYTCVVTYDAPYRKSGLNKVFRKEF